MNPGKRRGPAQDRPPPDDQVTTSQPDEDILPFASAYCVIAITPYGTPRRRVFLSLHAASQAVQRAKQRGLSADLVLCKLVPIAAGLDLDGEVTS